MIDPSLIWTGRSEKPTPSSRRIGLYDTTLRDGEQTVGVAFSADAKLAIARGLDRLGVDRIEAGFPMVSAEDARAIELILEAELDAEIWGFARAVPADIQQLVDIGVKSAVIEAPVSDQKLNAFGISRDSIVNRISEAIEAAQRGEINVCFFGVDGSRSDREFLERVYRAAVECGAQELAVVDTLGVASPEFAAELVRRVRDWVGPDLPIHWHGHNDFGVATAGAIAAVGAGANWVQGTINGMGERAGNADIAEFALAIEALYGYETSLRFESVLEVSQLVQRLSGYDLAPWKPVTGRNLFIRESGGVVAQFHDPPAIEPFSAELVGAVRGIVLGKKSGMASIELKSNQLGLSVREDLRNEVLARVKARGAQKAGLVTDEEFIQFVTDAEAQVAKKR